MADGDLQSALAGGGPLGPLELMGGIAAQQAVRPENYSAGPVGQAMGMWGQTLAQGRAQGYAQQLAQAQTAAMGDMGKYLAADDPVAAAANDTGGNPVARWHMLNTTPEQVAQMRQALSAAQLQRAEAGLYGTKAAGLANPPPFPGQPGGPAAVLPPPGGRPIPGQAYPMAGGRYLPGAAPAPVSGTADVDLGPGTAQPSPEYKKFAASDASGRAAMLGPNSPLPAWQRSNLRREFTRFGSPPLPKVNVTGAAPSGG